CGATCDQADAGEPKDAGPDGAVCSVTASCGIYMNAFSDGGSETGWTCVTGGSGLATNQLHCRHVDNAANASCFCENPTDAGDAGEEFLLPTTDNAAPSNELIQQLWKNRCNGCPSSSTDADAGDASDQ